MFNCVTGMYTPTSGKVRLRRRGHHRRRRRTRSSRHGIARTFQNLALFGGLTVLENLLVGAYRQGSSGLLQGAVLSRPRARRAARRGGRGARGARFPRHAATWPTLLPGELPYGRQKQVEFARALMQKARLVLLDEPMAGMSAAEKAAMTALIQRVRARATA